VLAMLAVARRLLRKRAAADQAPCRKTWPNTGKPR